MPAGGRGRRRPALGVLAGILLLLVPLGALFPGDTVFINDEPRFIGAALAMNRTREWPSLGLMGSRSLPQGPVPVWVYALLLRGWPDLEDLALVRTLAARALVAASILMLAAAVPDLDPLAGAAALLAPYLWVYSRQLWSFDLLLSLAALAFAAYVSFCSSPRRWKLWLAASAAVGSLLIHLTAVAPAAALGLHFAWVHRKWSRKHPWTVTMIAVAACASAGTYAASVLGAALAGIPPGNPFDPTGSVWRGAANAALGGIWFSTWGFDRYFGPAWTSRLLSPGAGAALAAVTALTWLAVPVVLAGAVAGVRRTMATRRSGVTPPSPADHAVHVALLVVAAQAALQAFGEIGSSPHYQCATWPAHFLLAWTFVSSRRGGGPKPPAARAGLAAWSLAVVLVGGLTIRMAHRDGGNQRETWGPALRVQIAAVRAMAACGPASRFRFDVPNWRAFPHAPAVIRMAYGLHANPAGPALRMVARPASDDPDDGRIVVEEEGKQKKP